MFIRIKKKNVLFICNRKPKLEALSKKKEYQAGRFVTRESFVD